MAFHLCTTSLSVKEQLSQIKCIDKSDISAWYVSLYETWGLEWPWPCEHWGHTSDNQLSQWVDIEAKGSSPLSMGNYIQFGRSHESDFHRITQFGSKISHRSVTCVTCDTRVTVCDSAPSFGPSPWRLKTRQIFTGKGNRTYNRRKMTLKKSDRIFFFFKKKIWLANINITHKKEDGSMIKRKRKEKGHFLRSSPEPPHMYS